MPKDLENIPSEEKIAFTQYRSSDYSIIDYLDKSSGSSVSPKSKPQLAYRSLSSLLPPITLRHKYTAFRNLETDISDLSTTSPSLPTKHPYKITKKSSRIMNSKNQPFRGL